MKPTVWGPYFWHTIHIAALGYPQNPTPDESSAYREFYTRIRHILPCKKCGSNYIRHLEELPIDEYLMDRDSLFTWTVNLHNLVNTQHNKPTWTVQRALKYYSSLAPLTDMSKPAAPGTLDPVISAAPGVPKNAVYILIGINISAILLVLVLMGLMVRSRLRRG